MEILAPPRPKPPPSLSIGKHSGRPVCTVTSRLEHSILNTNRCHHLTSTFETPRTWCTLQHLLLDTRRNSQVSPSTRHTRLFHPLPIRHRVMAVQASSSCALLLESSNPSNPPVQTEDKAFPPSPGSPHLAPSPLMCTSITRLCSIHPIRFKYPHPYTNRARSPNLSQIGIRHLSRSSCARKKQSTD